MNNILVIGCNGQLGTELIAFLRELHGQERVIGADIRKPVSTQQGTFEVVDALDFNQIRDCVQKHHVKEVYHLAAILSVNSEKNPLGSWDLNMKTLLNVLELGRQGFINKIFWPGSIAAFGPSTPRENTPQNTLMDPNTSYGISKLAGERWCDYYYQHYGVDVRSLRYPGIISYKTGPGGGTTDYAIDIFFQAIKTGAYECFLKGDTRLPMMFIDDAVRAAVELMQAPKESINVRSSYNITAMSFTPAELTREIQKHLPSFKTTYAPDSRQNIADSWPASLDDSRARAEWGWSPKKGLVELVETMLQKINNHTSVS